MICFTLGQMSYWALVVISNLLSAIPYVGYDLLYWFWGDCFIGSISLSRFLCLHYLFPMILVVFIILHIVFVHVSLSIEYLVFWVSSVELLSFYPLVLLKDCLFIMVVWCCISILVLCYSFSALHPDSFLYFNAFITPAMIEPEWYFLPYYAVLRSIPHKLIEFMCLLLSSMCFLSFIHWLSSMSICLESSIVYTGIVLFGYLGYLAMNVSIWPVTDVTLLGSVLYLGMFTMLVYCSTWVIVISYYLDYVAWVYSIHVSTGLIHGLLVICILWFTSIHLFHGFSP